MRPHLLGVAYRLPGTFADAERAVLDTWVRWDPPAAVIADGKARFTVVVGLTADQCFTTARTGV
ncbi:hypothetical protein BVC93_02955 [Mycobacterium sp. MS1601]|nr:hypothetical protein BVC93_02955 [Mycobacterium sp. MS1601]